MKVATTVGVDSAGGPDFSRYRWLAPSVLVGFAGITGLAIANLIGWSRGSSTLIGATNGMSPTQPATSVALILLALGGACQVGSPGWGRRVLGLFAGIAVLLAASWSFLGYLLSARVPVDELFFARHLDPALPYPGRPSVQTLAVLICLAAALVGLSRREQPWSRGLAVAGEVGALAILSVVIVSFISGAGEITVFDRSLAMSWPTAATLLWLLCALFSAKPERPPLVWLTDGTIDGFTVSRVLPAIILVPITVRGVQSAGERVGLTLPDAQLLAELVALFMIGVTLIFVALAKQRVENEFAARQAIYRVAIDVLREGLTIRSADGTTAISNPVARDLARGVYRDDHGSAPVTIGSTWYDEQGEQIDVSDTPTNVTMRTGRPVRGRVVRVGQNEEARWVLVNAVPLGKTGGVVTTVSDITDRTRAEQQLRDAEEGFRTAFVNAPIGISLVGVDGSFRRVNPALCALLGMDSTQLLAMSSRDLSHPGEFAETLSLSRKLLADEIPSFTTDRRFRHADGSWVWTTMSVSLVRQVDGEPEHFVAQILDQRERKRLEFELSHMAMHDALTELPNRRLVLDRLAHSLRRSARRAENMGVIYIDLDGFKDINDTFGHDVGDEVLVEVSRRLRASLRRSDTAGRLGGDEFIVISEDLADPSDLEDVVARIERDLHDDVFVGELTIPLRASVGSCLARDGDDAANLLRIADGAMYAAKRRRRGERTARLRVVRDGSETGDGA